MPYMLFSVRLQACNLCTRSIILQKIKSTHVVNFECQEVFCWNNILTSTKNHFSWLPYW